MNNLPLTDPLHCFAMASRDCMPDTEPCSDSALAACRSELARDWENYDMSELPDEVWWFQDSNNNAKSVTMEPEG